MKLLVIVTGDYGEYGAAMYFLQGLPSSVPPVVMVPASLAHAMPARPGHDLRTYAGRVDIERVLEADRPDTVLLASGYLLPINSGLSLVDSLKLLRTLKKRRITVLTSDPFVGLLRSRALAMRVSRGFGTLTIAAANRWMSEDFKAFRGRWRRRRTAVAANLGYAFALSMIRHMLRRAWNIYPVPITDLHPGRKARRLSYFSAAPRRSDAATQPEAALRPTWLFVLSKIDSSLQARAQGERFVDHVADRLRDTVRLNRHAMLIGPEDLVSAVRARLGDAPGITLHSNLPYDQYMRSLMAAEYSFFWNYFSFSILHRVLDNRPAFFFHAGHMAHTLPALGNEGVRVIYDGWRPPLLPVDSAFDEQDLARRAAEVVREFGRIGEGVRRCPSPVEVLRRATGMAPD